MNKTLNIVMILASAIVLVALNVGVFFAAGSGAMTPINNLLLWGGFVVLNVASILWAISMLGLQPLVVSISYVAGGALAFLGVRGMTDISVAEVTTAGATYGAFGALAIGNATTKVRLAFFNKGQVPFIFIIAGLLVVDAVLNSQISSAGTGVLLNAVLLPFIIAGVTVGLVWSGLNRFGIGKKPSEVLAAKDAALAETASVAQDKVVIPMPEHAVVAEEPAPAPQPAKKVAKVEPLAPAAKAAPAPVAEPQPVVAEAAPVEEEKEEFFPLEIDKNDDILLPKGGAQREETEPAFEVPTFDAELYASGSQDSDGGVMVKEPAVSVETQPVQPVAKPAPAVAEATPEPVVEKEEEKKESGGDFLSGHLDLLNKLK